MTCIRPPPRLAEPFLAHLAGCRGGEVSARARARERALIAAATSPRSAPLHGVHRKGLVTAEGLSNAVQLDQGLVSSLEDRARWSLKSRGAAAAPSLLELVDTQFLKAVEPRAMRIAGR